MDTKTQLSYSCILGLTSVFKRSEIISGSISNPVDISLIIPSSCNPSMLSQETESDLSHSKTSLIVPISFSIIVVGVVVNQADFSCSAFNFPRKCIASGDIPIDSFFALRNLAMILYFDVIQMYPFFVLNNQRTKLLLN